MERYNIITWGTVSGVGFHFGVGLVLFLIYGSRVRARWRFSRELL
jgi:hypothetical protein